MRTKKQIDRELVRLRAIIDNCDGLESEVAYIVECAIYWVTGYPVAPSQELNTYVKSIEERYQLRKK